MVFLLHILPVLLLRSAAMQCKKAKICNKNSYFSLQSKKSRRVQCLRPVAANYFRDNAAVFGTIGNNNPN